MFSHIFSIICAYFKNRRDDEINSINKIQNKIQQTQFNRAIFNDLKLTLKNFFYQQLGKYIYVEHDVAMNVDFVKRCNKNFMVYIVTVDKYQKPGMDITNAPRAIKGTTDVTNEEPKTSSREQKTAKPVCKQNTSITNQNLEIKRETSKSKIPISTSKCNTKTSKLKTSKHKSVQEISQREMTESAPKPHKGYELFKKLINLPKSLHSNPSVSMEEIFLRDYSFEGKGKKICKVTSDDSKDSNEENISMPVSYISIPNPYLDYTMAEAMREMVEIGSKILESEARVTDVVKKYVQDNCLQNDLLNIISGHEKLLLDSGRRALTITNDTWFHQAEIYKGQQKSLQNTINSVVQQNKELHNENELMMKKNEKLCTKIVIMQETHASSHRSPAACAGQLLEDMNKQNDKLRMKLSFMGIRVDELEENLQLYQRKNGFLQQQLNGNNIQLENMKALHERSKADYDLEIAKLLHDVQENNLMMKEVDELGDILLEDLDTIKSQLESLSVSVNWKKFESKGKSPIDVLHIGRTCVKDLALELMNKDKKINDVLHIMQQLKEENEKHKAHVDELIEEKVRLNENIESFKETVVNLKVMQEKHKELGDKFSDVEKISVLKTTEVQNLDKNIQELNEKIQKFDGVIADKDETIVRMRDRIGKLEHERTSFQAQINGMAQVLSATGTGEIAKELASSQEKLTQIHAQHLSLAAEKDYLMKVLEANNTERETLIAYQKSCYDQLQLLQKDLDLQEKTNEGLKEQLETEKQTVTALQSERVRHLEERSVLTAVYERLRAETSKVDQLEGTVSTMNQKAGKLAMIAEYNKQMGEKLQIVVAEKDVAINELQNNVKELSNFHIENTKEKVALCEELTQVFTVKEVLNEKLTAELEKNVKLDETKKEIESLALIQLEELHAKYEKERTSRKALAKELKGIAIRRDALKHAIVERDRKLKVLESKNAALMKDIVQLKQSNGDFSEKLSANERKNLDESAMLKEQVSKLEGQISLYQEASNALKSMMEPITKENTDLKNSVEYLQADVRKLQSDLDMSREKQKGYKETVTQYEDDCKMLQQTIDERIEERNKLLEEYQKLYAHYTELDANYKQLKQEYDLIIDDTNRIKMIVTSKFPDRKSSSMESDGRTKEINERDEVIIFMQEKIRELEEDNSNCSDMIANLSVQRDAIAKGEKCAKQELAEVQQNYEQSLQQISELEELLHSYDQKYRELLEDLQKKTAEFDIKIENITSEFQSQIEKQDNEISCLAKELEDTKLAHADEICSKEKLQKAHRTLAMKLMKAVKVLIAEKSLNDNLQEKCSKMLDDNKKLELEELQQKEEAVQQRREILELKSEIDSMKTETDSLIAALSTDENKTKQSDNISNDSRIDARIMEYEERVSTLQDQLEKNYQENARLLDELSSFESKYACLEFQKCESILRLHEVQGKVQTEKARNEDLVQCVKGTIKLLIALKDEGAVPKEVCNTIIATVRNCAEF